MLHVPRLALGFWFAAALAGRGHAEEPLARASVGMPVHLHEIVLPGPELEAAPADARAPVVLRIDQVRPHGDSWRYDFTLYALEPGTHDLRRWLRRRDGSAAEGLPPLPFSAESVLPPDRVTPGDPRSAALPRLGGYRHLLILGGAAWIMGLVALLAAGRRRPAGSAAAAGPAAPTLADRLRPLVERALRGTLPARERAALELGLVALWRRRLHLEDVPAREVLERLREHPEAGPLLRGLEDWLHRPDPPQGVDVGALLAPYRDLPPEALDAPEQDVRAEAAAR